MKNNIIQEEPKSKKKALKNDAKINGEYKKRYKRVSGSLYEKTKKYAGCLDTGIPDLSYNKIYWD